jgi:hypothetical protein
MNKVLGTVFLFFFTLQAFCQEQDTILVWQQQDTIPARQGQDSAAAFQQYDTTYQIGEEALLQADTLMVEVREPKSPTRALMYALILPGLGQAYNGKYWKIPIVWAALGGATYAISYNTGMYEEAMFNYIQERSETNERIVKGWKRNMELSYIVAILVYGLQVLDAYVDANLYTWDVNENLSLGISPSLQPMMSHTSLSGYSGGLTCSLKIRGR